MCCVAFCGKHDGVGAWVLLCTCVMLYNVVLLHGYFIQLSYLCQTFVSDTYTRGTHDDTSQTDNAAELFRRACKIFNTEADLLHIWDFSGRTSLFFANDNSSPAKDIQRQLNQEAASCHQAVSQSAGMLRPVGIQEQRVVSLTLDGYSQHPSNKPKHKVGAGIVTRDAIPSALVRKGDNRHYYKRPLKIMVDQNKGATSQPPPCILFGTDVIERIISLGFYYRKLDRFTTKSRNLSWIRSASANVSPLENSEEISKRKSENQSVYRRAIANAIVEILSVYRSAILQIEQKLLADPLPILATVTQGLNKHYPEDFSEQEKYQLEWKPSTYPLVDRLIRLVLPLSISTPTCERAFSAMNIVKTQLRSKMEDDFLRDVLGVYIEKEIVVDFSVESLIDDFASMKNRRMADWSMLPEKILGKIPLKLDSIEDFVYFSWNLVFAMVKLNWSRAIKPTTPWLLLIVIS
uniref:UBP8/5-like ubiquitin-like domain-containing protein n=1 Tax=Chenopodium quinoa TaxID=63459 RepID=A0A803N1Y5_CHEQI